MFEFSVILICTGLCSLKMKSKCKTFVNFCKPLSPLFQSKVIMKIEFSVRVNWFYWNDTIKIFLQRRKHFSVFIGLFYHSWPCEYYFLSHFDVGFSALSSSLWLPTCLRTINWKPRDLWVRCNRHGDWMDHTFCNRKIEPNR